MIKSNTKKLKELSENINLKKRLQPAIFNFNKIYVKNVCSGETEIKWNCHALIECDGEIYNSVSTYNKKRKAKYECSSELLNYLEVHHNIKYEMNNNNSLNNLEKTSDEKGLLDNENTYMNPILNNMCTIF